MSVGAACVDGACDIVGGGGIVGAPCAGAAASCGACAACGAAWVLWALTTPLASHAFTDVYHLPSYSRLSTSQNTFT